jgi:hypothetical protein
MRYQTQQELGAEEIKNALGTLACLAIIVLLAVIL